MKITADYEKIINGCCRYPSLKRIAISMIDYADEYLQQAIENQTDGIYVIKEKDIPTMSPLDDFNYGIFLEMLDDRKEIDEINTDNGDIEMYLDMEYISEMDGGSAEQAPSLSL